MPSKPLKTVSADVDAEDNESNEQRRRSRRSSRDRTRDVRKGYFFLTVPGFIRLLIILLSTLHIGCHGYYGTYYDSIVEKSAPPLLMTSSREAFFLLVNFHSLLTTLTLVASSMMSYRSHQLLLGTLYMFLFDFLQFLLVVAAAAGIMLLYTEEDAKIAYAPTLTTRQGLSITGMILACMHLIASIYDISIFMKKYDSVEALD